MKACVEHVAFSIAGLERQFVVVEYYSGAVSLRPYTLRAMAYDAAVWANRDPLLPYLPEGPYETLAELRDVDPLTRPVKLKQLRQIALNHYHREQYVTHKLLGLE